MFKKLCSLALAAAIGLGPIVPNFAFAQAAPGAGFVKSTANLAATNAVVSSLKEFDRINASVKRGSTAEKATLRTTAQRALQDARNAQNTARQLIADLKAANKWTKEFDDFVDANLRKNGADARFVQFFKEQGGARAVLEKSVSPQAITDLKAELDADLKAVGAQQVSITDLLITSAYAKCIKCGCVFYAVAAAACLSLGAIPCAISSSAGGLACVSKS